jgi:8-oxo-dGTP pyrophosphatase MutT (NUDIX family)
MRTQIMVLLTQRTQHLSTHSGQIAFPGGMSDLDDVDATATALREAKEEIGLERHHIEVIGTLPVYTTGSAFLVTPVVALVSPALQIQANPHEVADVFEVPLAFLMDPANHRHHAMDWAGARREWLSMPYVDANEQRFIWGATAGMLRNLYRFLVD